MKKGKKNGGKLHKNGKKALKKCVDEVEVGGLYTPVFNF